MKKQDIRTFEQAEAYLNSTPRFTTKHEMEETCRFLEVLGHPDRKLRIIHVAGTNGKGSVSAFLQSILRGAGYSVGLFTSPHLVDIRERFCIDGEMIEKEEFLQIFLEIYEALSWEELEKDEGYHPTYFEYIFFIGILYFAKYLPDVCILETGLGGRLDATNSVLQKDLSVITRISLDHVQYLGNTIPLIAGEKAGIIMQNVPVVYGDFVPEASRVISEKAKQLHSAMYPVGPAVISETETEGKNLDFSLSTLYYNIARLSIPTCAKYQVENAAIAVTAALVWTGGKLSPEEIRAGVAGFYWPGRMEEVIPGVFLDGAHNEDGVRAFLESVREDGVKKRSLLFAAVSDKDVEHMVSQVAEGQLFDEVTVVPMHTGRSLLLPELQVYFAKYPSLSIKAEQDAVEALSHMIARREDKQRIYVAGSLYLVGEIKAAVAEGRL